MDSEAYDRLVALLCVLPGGVKEVARSDSLGDAHVVTAGAGHVQLVSVHDSQQLFANVLCSLHGTLLDVVLHAPLAAELVVLPRVIHRQQREVVALRLREVRPLLIRLYISAHE